MITTDDVLHIAKLSRLEFNNTEIDNFKTDLNNVVNYVNELQQVNTNNIQIQSNSVNAENSLRLDQPEQHFSQDESVVNAPSKKYGAFSVPTVIE